MKNIIDSGHAPGATRPSGAGRCPEGKRDDVGRTKLREVFEKTRDSSVLVFSRIVRLRVFPWI